MGLKIKGFNLGLGILTFMLLHYTIITSENGGVEAFIGIIILAGVGVLNFWLAFENE